MVWLGSLIGCAGDIASDYQLTIVPHLLPDQSADLLGAQPDVKLLVRPPDAPLSVWYLGRAGEGASLTLEARPPLSAGTTLGLILEKPNDTPQNWHRRSTLAYGEVVLDTALDATEQSAEISILAPRVDTFSKIAVLDGADRASCGAIAALPDGRVFVFGGGDPDATDTLPMSGTFSYIGLVGSNAILEIDRGEDGWSAPEGVAKMPAIDFPRVISSEPEVHSGARVCSAAWPVETDDGWRILVFGGRYSYPYSSYNTPSWFEFDPDTAKIGRSGELLHGRSDFRVVPLGSNKLLLYGGLVSSGLLDTASYEIFTISSGEAVNGRNTSRLEGAYGGFATALGPSAVVCTGAAYERGYDGDPNRYIPGQQCVRIEAQDVLTDLADLPSPVFAGSVAALPDGGVLVTGGTGEPVTGGHPVPASALAYRWDPQNDHWSSVGPLKHARGYHQSFLMPDGRVVIVGGVTEIGGLYDQTGPAVRCTEVFDPSTNRFDQTTCNDASSGQNPSLSVVPGTAAILQGIEYDGPTEGGGALGVLSLIPEL